MVGKNLQDTLTHASDIFNAIEGLKRGDRVVVLWHDACRVTNDPDVRSEYYSTPKETEGTVYDCLPDPTYPDVFYLIITGEKTFDKPDYYDAIPVAWIAKIERLEPVPMRQPKKDTKLLSDSYTVKRQIIFKKGVPAQDTGGIERLPRKWTDQGLATRKFVEVIEKVII
jgi:hypothetical protein